MSLNTDMIDERNRNICVERGEQIDKLNRDLAALTRQRDGLVKLLEESMNVFLHDADCFKSSAAEHMAKKLKAALEAAKKEQG